MLLLAAISVTLTALATRWWNPRAVAFASVIPDALLVGYSAMVSTQPEVTASMLLIPVIGAGYFADWRASIGVTAVAAGWCVVMAETVPAWGDPRVFPTISLALILCGSLISFAMHQGRRAELRLERSLVLDRRALRLARRVHFGASPVQALEDIAREVGLETGTQLACVARFDLEDGSVAELATWRAEHATDAHLSADLFDEPLRAAIAHGHGIVVAGDSVRLLDGHLRQARGNELRCPQSAVASMQALLATAGFDSGVLLPMSLGTISIGAIVLAHPGDDWQADARSVLEPVAPQLAAGLAQAVVVRDQQEALESLERLDRLRDRLIANVSHELRTPLTSTIGFIETLMRDDVPIDEDTRRQLMEHAREGGHRLLALVEDLLALGSTRPESLELSPEPVPARELIESALRSIEFPADRELELDLRDDAFVVADCNRMLQVITNLVVNAVRHGNGPIAIATHPHGPLTTIDVLDDGPGVLPEHEDELFLPFARFSTRPDSTGLGLAICRTIVEAHGGSIRYARVEGGRRTRFRVHLPAHVTERAEPAA
jgi:signal transduction histidine kinase